VVKSKANLVCKSGYKLAPCGGGCAKILKWMLLTPTLDYAWHWMLADSHT
jgi:hypothetical protein